MDSEDSRPGSSASNSSSSSVDSNENIENGSVSSSRKSRSKSANSNSSSENSSRNHSPESQAAVLKEPQSPVQNYEQDNHDSQSRSMSRTSNRSDMSSDGQANGSANSRRESRSTDRENRASSREQSVSPIRETCSRNSSVSSLPAKNGQRRNDAINISHEDLSDVSDLESATASPINNDKPDDNEADQDKALAIVDLRQKINEKKNQHKADNKQNDQGNKQNLSIVDEINDIMDKKHDEDALDFEAEDGECADEKDEKPTESKEPEKKSKKDSDGEIEEGEELEEGEVSDEDEKRPEETEPKPVCRFYTRGQCTWGMSCRFLHPGVTDKGNYTMFDMIRPVPVNAHAPPYGPGGVVPSYHHDFRSERPGMHPMHNAPPQARPMPEPVVESAWERGLRTAKEMMRKANKRKEQDMDFEDKKMNLSASQDELEKDNYYIRDRSPEIPSQPAYGRPPIGVHHPIKGGGYSPPAVPHKYGMAPRPAPIPYEDDPYGRSIRYRELPPHRMPQYEDEIMAGKRRIRPAREVIVQPVGRGDEWNDPWMRSKSPGREREKRQKRERRSYSTNSSYSSSSSSQSGSSSNSSRSPTPNQRRRYNATRPSGHKSPVRGRHVKRSQTPDVHKRRHSPAQIHPNVSKEPHFDAKKDLRNHPTLSKRANPNIVVRRSPPKKRQATPPIIEKRVTRSPVVKRKRQASPPPPPPRKPISFSISSNNNLRKKKRSSSSGSGSSDSSGSESGSSDSSSSSESSSRNGHKPRSRDKIISERKLASKKVEAAAKKRSPPAQSGSSKTSETNNTSKSNSSSSSSVNAKKSTRREELLKQLRAVEDAIARKRSKLS